MPDLIPITCYTCPSNRFWHKKVTGSNSQSYDVTYTDYEGWRCTCPAFAFKIQEGDCKHIKQVYDERCGWNWEAYTGATGEKQLIDGCCPKCGEEAEAIRVAV